MANLKRLFGLREMAVNVPDKHVPGLKRAIKAAQKADPPILPPEADSWVQDKGAADSGTWTGPGPAPKGHPDYEDPNNPVLKTKPKAAKAVGKKSDTGYDPKIATRSSKSSTATPKPVDADLEDDWFQDSPSTKGKAAPVDPDASDDDFPVFPDSQAMKTLNSPQFTKGIGEPDGDDAPTFNSAFYTGPGHSSWDDVPDWMRDPEKMPAPGNSSSRASWDIPRSATSEPDDDIGTVPGKLPKKAKGKQALSPVGRPWSAKDVGGDEQPKKQGMLSRIFGRKK